MNEKIYLAILHKIGINQRKLHIIFEKNSNYKDFYEKLSFDTLKYHDFSDKQIEFILNEKKEVKINDIKKVLDTRSVSIVTKNDINYPSYLKEIPNTPYMFYLRGKIDNSPKIAVVGSRKITSYGEKIIENIVGELSNYFVIVSGGAAGCDTKGHLIALENNNKTISVIGTGINIDYPVYNKKMYDNIVEKGGGIISIFPIGEIGNPYNFPIRNEIVAGISKGVFVVEAKNKSGTLITANLALDLGKDLFAVPGDIFKNSSDGCNTLIKSGMAKLVTNSDDILEEYNLSNKKDIDKKNKLNFDDNIEESIYNFLLLENLTINEISLKIGLDIPTTSFKVSMLEVKNVIKKNYGGKYEIF